MPASNQIQVAGAGTAFLGTPTKLIIVGDSMSDLVIAYGASSVANMWANKFGVALGLTPQHGGHGNYVAAQYWTSDSGDFLTDQIITSTTLSAGLWGYNNMFLNGPNSATPLGAYYLSDYAVDCYAVAAWLAVPNTQKVLTIVPGSGGATVTTQNMSLSGTWTVLSGTPNGANGIYAGGGSSGTVNFYVQGDTVRLWYARFGPAASQASVIYNIAIDGVTITQTSCQCQCATYQSIPAVYGTNNYTIACTVIGGLTNGPHVVTVTVTGTSGQNGIVYGASGSVSTNPPGPAVLMGSAMRGSATGYANGGNTIVNPVASGITAPEVAVMGDNANAAQNAVVERVAKRLQAEGLAVYYVDTNIDYDLLTQQSTGDYVHPNNYGHQMICQKMLEAMKINNLII